MREPDGVLDFVCDCEGVTVSLEVSVCDEDIVWLGERVPEEVLDLVCDCVGVTVSLEVSDCEDDNVWLDEREPDAVPDCEGDPVSEAGHSAKSISVIQAAWKLPPVDPAKPIHAVPSPSAGAASRAPLMSRLVENVAVRPPLEIVHVMNTFVVLMRQSDTATLKMIPGTTDTAEPNVPEFESAFVVKLATEDENPVEETAAPVLMSPEPPLNVLKTSANLVAELRHAPLPAFEHCHVGIAEESVW